MFQYVDPFSNLNIIEYHQTVSPIHAADDICHEYFFHLLERKLTFPDQSLQRLHPCSDAIRYSRDPNPYVIRLAD